MANIDLSGYNLSELKGLKYDIENEIKNRQHETLRKAREQILTIAQEAGVSLQALLAADEKTKTGAAKSSKRQKVKPRYRNPGNESQTWTGRGRQPKWMSEGLAGGKSLEDFRM